MNTEIRMRKCTLYKAIGLVCYETRIHRFISSAVKQVSNDLKDNHAFQGRKARIKSLTVSSYKHE